MLKRLAIIAVLFSVAQALVPATGQTPDKGAHDRKDKGQTANASASPSQTAMPVAARDRSHQQAAINISNSAPMSEWTWHDKIAWLSGLILTGFLIWGVLVARGTLKAIEKQAAHMIASERAWLVMRSSMGSYTPGQDGDNWMYWWEIENTGHTPARIIETQCLYEIVEWDNHLIFPETLNYPMPIEAKGFLLPPGGKRDYNTFLRARDGRVVNPSEMEVEVIHMIASLWLCKVL
jgi:hypothetical protein